MSAKLVAAMAKLSGIKIAVGKALSETVRRGSTPEPYRAFVPENVAHYFEGAEAQRKILAVELPLLYGDFQQIATEPTLVMIAATNGNPEVRHFSRNQMERLGRDIDQIFEIRSNAELAPPIEKIAPPKCVFITHGHSPDWREVQAFLERDFRIPTKELAQEPSSGMTIIEKLLAVSEQCDSAVIVMTAEDETIHGDLRARENVMHEIGFFQGKYGRGKVVLLHEDSTSIPTNLSGVVYVPFAKGNVSATFPVLGRELTAIYSQ